jgi:sortase A
MASQGKSRLGIALKAMGITSRLLIAAGAVLLVFYAVATIHSLVMSRLALRQFSEEQHTKKAELPLQPSIPPKPAAPPIKKRSVDFSLWSSQRVAAFKKAFARQTAPPEAVLEIPRIGLEAPVFDGTDDLTLNRGVGRIIGTARLDQEGNLGIAGHRDGFFRGLKDVVVGDSIQLKTSAGTETYRVDQIRIVKPNDVQVLKDRAVPTLTLVTCYPFYYIGNAPLRYIVRASVAGRSASLRPGVDFRSTAGKLENQEEAR